MITDPNDLNGLPPGDYEVAGKAVDVLWREYGAATQRLIVRLGRDAAWRQGTLAVEARREAGMIRWPKHSGKRRSRGTVSSSPYVAAVRGSADCLTASYAGR